MMNWPEIESVIYSDGDRPDLLLGAHDQNGGVLIQTFRPGVNRITVVLERQDGADRTGARARIPMELADEDGFYACFLPGKKAAELRYHYEITTKDGSVTVVPDPYRFPFYFREEDERALSAGSHSSLYERLGAHPMQYDGVDGTWFACLAPSASRVSVVGDFNGWDARTHQMSRFEDTGIFGIFVPGVPAGAAYQFEIRAKSGITSLRSDPFAFAVKGDNSGQCVVTPLSGFPWKTLNPAPAATTPEGRRTPLSVYHFDPSAFGTFEEAKDVLPDYVSSLGFDAVAFSPVPADNNTLFAPDPQFGSPDSLMSLVDALHEKKLRCFFTWNPVSFIRTRSGLSLFDAAPLFESPDDRRRDTPDGRSSYFDCANPEICSFLLSNALFFVRVYHADGLLTTDLSPQLYLDYGRQEMDHAVNMYGGVQNLEAVAFFRNCNAHLHKEQPGTITIAETDSVWSGVTGNQEDSSLGFDYKLHTAFRDALVRYLRTDPLFRRGKHNLLLEDMVYQYTEQYMLPFLAQDMGPSRRTILDALPGENEETKYASLRLLIASMMVHPGAKILNLGETLADVRAALDNGKHHTAAATPAEGLGVMTAALNHLYHQDRAFYENDDHPDGFEWIRQMANDQNMLCFLRKGSHPDDFAYIAVNYSGAAWQIRAGVPYAGSYRRIFSSSAPLYGGTGTEKQERAEAEPAEMDGRSHSMEFSVDPLSLSIFRYHT